MVSLPRKNYPGSLTASRVISEALAISNRNSERHVRSIKRKACLPAIFDIYEMQDVLNQHKFKVASTKDSNLEMYNLLTSLEMSLPYGEQTSP